MVAESDLNSDKHSSGGKNRSVVGQAKDSRAEIGGSSMDAEIGSRGSKTEPETQSYQYNKLDKHEYDPMGST